MKKVVSIGVGELVFVILLVGKIAGVIEMGWFWVLTSFIWAPLLVLLVMMAAIFFVGLVVISVVAWLEK